MFRILLPFLLVSVCTGTVYFEEDFLDENSFKDWVQSTHHPEIERGKWSLTKSKHWDEKATTLGLKTTEDSRFYGISKKIATPFTNKDKPLVLQYAVKFEETVSCGGAYIKLLPSDTNQDKFHGETPYLFMFGPDICGYSKKMVHAIFNYKGKNHLIKKEAKCKDDLLSHLYTFILHPNNTYIILIDNENVQQGNLEDDWEMLAPKQIDDPNAKKPEDWVDEEEIVDPNDKKPEDWDQPKTIPDENAKKPEDWDDEMDGDWERPQIDNPNYKGEWEPKKIPNPAFKGHWTPPKIDNPEFKPDTELYVLKDVGVVGFELWQVVSGSIFHHILITDDPEFARSEGEKKWRPLVKIEEEKKKEEDKRKEEEDKKKEEEDKKREEEEKKLAEAKKAGEKQADDADANEKPDAAEEKPDTSGGKTDAHEEL